MFRRLYRQRRRYLMASVMLFAVLAVAFVTNGAFRSEGLTPADPVAWLALALTSLVIVSAALPLVTWVIPDVRHVFEIGILTTSLVAIADGFLGGAIALANMSMLFFASAFLMVERLIYGQVLDHWTAGPVSAKTRLFRTDLSPEAAWRRLVSLPGNEAEYHVPGTLIAPVAGTPDTYTVSYPNRNGQTYQVETMRVIEADFPQTFRATFEPAVRSEGSGGLSGRIEIQIVPEHGGSRVMVEERRDAAPLRRRLQWFLDDEFNDRMDSVISRMSARRDWSLFGRQLLRPQAAVSGTGRSTEA